jgi:hypothetical protein
MGYPKERELMGGGRHMKKIQMNMLDVLSIQV